MVADPDTAPKSMSTPEDHPETDEAAAKRFPARPLTPSRGVGHEPLPEPGAKLVLSRRECPFAELS